jgi:alkyl-hydroperoxide reductase/thiol specific antioxidant family protein
LREFDQEIESRRGRVAVISFATPDQLRRFAERLGHPFLWLADPQRVSYKHLGLGRRGPMAIAPPRVVWGYIRLILGGRAWRPEQLDLAQMGGDFVFDRYGNLTLSHLGSSSDDRPSVDAVMAAFRRGVGEAAQTSDE